MKLIGLTTVGLAAILVATSALAATPAIGVASAYGSFTVNSAQVSGNSNIYDGSQINTGKSPSQIFLQGGSNMMLATNTGATLYNDHLVLSQGAVRVDNMDKYDVKAMGYRISPDAPGTQAAVRLNEGAVEVASMSGAVKVFDSNGAMLTRIGAGTASAFKPGQTGASGGGGGGAAGAIAASNLLLYFAIIAALAGIGLAAVALLNATGATSR